MIYLWIKALHVVAIISWMAGLLYLPRLFVYHSTAVVKSEGSNTFKIMERRLLKAIMHPAMVVVWLTGLYLAYDGNWFASGWFHLKLTAVLIMTAVQVWLARFVRQFRDDERPKSARFFRMINEVPTVLMILIVVMVIVKPF